MVKEMQGHRREALAGMERPRKAQELSRKKTYVIKASV